MMRRRNRKAGGPLWTVAGLPVSLSDWRGSGGGGSLHGDFSGSESSDKQRLGHCNPQLSKEFDSRGSLFSVTARTCTSTLDHREAARVQVCTAGECEGSQFFVLKV